MARTKTTKRKQRPTPRQPSPPPQPEENEEEENAEVEVEEPAEEEAEAEAEGAAQGAARGKSKARDKTKVKRQRRNPPPSPPPQAEEDEEEEDAEVAGQVPAPGVHILGQGKSWYRFRCHTKSLLDVIKYWKEEPRYYEACKKELEKAGFGGLLELHLANVPKKLFDSLMAQFDVHIIMRRQGNN